MAQMCVTDKAKEEFRQKKKTYADAMGVDISQVSDTDTLHWLCENIPASKVEQLSMATDNYKQKVIIIVGPIKNQEKLCELMDDFRYILQKIIEHPERLMAWCEVMKEAIDKFNAKHPPIAFPPKKRIDNVIDDGSSTDKPG
jgi:hypothetical protein